MSNMEIILFQIELNKKHLTLLSQYCAIKQFNEFRLRSLNSITTMHLKQLPNELRQKQLLTGWLWSLCENLQKIAWNTRCARRVRGKMSGGVYLEKLNAGDRQYTPGARAERMCPIASSRIVYYVRSRDYHKQKKINTELHAS